MWEVSTSCSTVLASWVHYIQRWESSAQMLDSNFNDSMIHSVVQSHWASFMIHKGTLSCPWFSSTGDLFMVQMKLYFKFAWLSTDCRKRLDGRNLVRTCCKCERTSIVWSLTQLNGVLEIYGEILQRGMLWVGRIYRSHDAQKIIRKQWRVSC